MCFCYYDGIHCGINNIIGTILLTWVSLSTDGFDVVFQCALLHWFGEMSSVWVKGQSWGFKSRSTARVILGQVLRIATCGTRTHRGDSL